MRTVYKRRDKYCPIQCMKCMNETIQQDSLCNSLPEKRVHVKTLPSPASGGPVRLRHLDDGRVLGDGGGADTRDGTCAGVCLPADGRAIH